MDLGFLRRAEARFASRAAALPDFGMLVAALASAQRASPAVRAYGRVAAAPAVAEPLVELLCAGPLWREARAVQRGAFHPRLARQRCVN
ncbi:MAG: hypothetical protein JO013_04615 [Alphaproteobacteria bacterium]|nr:hypothetical protein [Alphaproteobacteria bacterium]